jgi:putative ATP-dependent endonuclease of OLD family
VTVLVGPNNAGKTNILSAINFLLGERWPMPANLDERDFYNGDRSRPIFIGLYLEHPRFSYIEFDSSKAQYVLSACDRDGVQVRGFNGAMREELAFAYVDAARSFERQFGVSRWTLFGQAIRHLHEHLKRADEGAALAPLQEALDQAHGILRTDLYDRFETAMREAFAAQLSTSGYDLEFAFKNMDETNLYRNLVPTILEAGERKSASEVGSGVRNLLVLALFQAFAHAFRGDAVLGIEEPELYLHPHAQRSLARQFEELGAAGNQIFISTHSTHFLDITHSDRIVVVERCEDDEEETCTSIRTSTIADLVADRRALHPNIPFTDASVRAFLGNVRTAEMAEPYFARLTVVVEGPSEREALPIFCRHLNFDLDLNGASVVAAGGKTVIDTLVQLYRSHALPVFVIFDNDAGAAAEDRAYNRVLCRLLGIEETDMPDAQVHDAFAILSGNWERQLEADLEQLQPGLYVELVDEARQALGVRTNKNKPLVARYVAQALTRRGIVPPFVQAIVERLQRLA